MMMGMVLALVCRFRQAAHPANDIAQPVVRPTGGLRPAAIAARRAR